MSDDNFYWNMYGGGEPPKATTPLPQVPDRFKMASRVIGGMKAQNSHTKTVDIDGELHTFPKAEYVAQLETQLREARGKIRELENRQARIQKSTSRIMEKMRQIENDLANKIDIR